MFDSNKGWPILTESFCTKMLMLQLAVEVLTGKPVQILALDPNTGRGKVRIGNENSPITFVPDLGPELLEFALRTPRDDPYFYAARFSRTEGVRIVACDYEDRRLGLTPHCMRIGKSLADRREIPLPENWGYLRDWQRLNLVPMP